MQLKNDRGFTLIELLVVIAIIGILAGMVLVSMSGARSKARDARRMSDMRQFVSAQEMYYGELDSYFLEADTTPSPIVTAGGVSYMAAVPADPGTTAYACLINNVASTHATPIPAGQWFCYYAVLENAKVIGGTSYTRYTASQNGNFYRTANPTSATCDSQG